QFNHITGKSLTLNFDLELIATLLGITIFTGLVSGSYPAFYMSGFNPAIALKGKLSNNPRELITRKGLVIFQFIISVILIISVLAVYKQIKFIQNKDLGYDKDNIISFAKEGRLEKNFQAFLSQIKTIPGVINASYMYGNLAGGVSSRSGGFSWEKQTPAEQQTQFDYLDVDYGLIETLGLKIESGRTFSKDFGSDSSGIIFNETAIKAMGIKDPIGKTVTFYGKRRIIGVVKDFHFESLFEKVKPFFFKIDYENEGNIMVRIKSGTEKNTLAQIQKTYKDFNEGFPFEYKFLDEDYQAQYDLENKVSILSRYFAGIAIVISCLGIFGLTAFTIERRLKEIAIRKTLGCSESGIIYLLSADFIRVILLATMIAFPLSYILIIHWLNSFAYKISLEWWYFACAGLLTLLMACIPMGIQIFKAARISPSGYLKES
ncbi:MAG TPA: FtsX-like permease family protein, partial [Pedobacter sp.]